MKQYYYMIYFDSETKEWFHDTLLESDWFEDGTIFNPETEQWDMPYDENDDLIPEQKYVDEIFADGITFLNRISAVWHLRNKEKNNDNQISNS